MDGAVVNDMGGAVTMVRYECCECDMGATCVLNEASATAWHDHMLNHVSVTHFQAWTWTVLPLVFDDRAISVSLDAY